VCILCWRRLVVTRDWKREGAFITTVPNDHNRKYHADTDGSKRSQHRLDTFTVRKTAAMLVAGSNSAGAPPPPSSAAMAAFYVSPGDKALASAARLYIYGTGHMSKETFNDPEFRGMNQAFYVAGGGRGKAPVLTTKGLKRWLDTEYDVFKTFARCSFNRVFEYAMGNPPGQGIHDCTTLDNKEKCMAVGWEFIPEDISRNIVLCLGLRRIDGGDDATAVAMLNEAFEEVFGRPYTDCSNQTVSDVAALGAARLMGQDRNPCNMHQTDKISRSATGDLDRSKMGVKVNPFPEGVKVMNRFHAAAVHFSFSTRFKQLQAFGPVVSGGLTRARPQVDLNTTRVAARQSLVRSMVRLYKGLVLYAAAYKPLWKLEEEDWVTGCEFLAVYDIAGKVSTLVQTEKQFTAALIVPLTEGMIEAYRGDVFKVVDYKSVTASPVLPLLDKELASFSAVGQEAVMRAQLEAERRFCGNATEHLTGAPVELTRRDKLSMLLDLRTVNCDHIAGRDGLRRESKALLKESFLVYSFRAHKFMEDKKSAEAAKEAAGKKSAIKAVAKALGKKRIAPVAGAAASDTPAAVTSRWTDDEDDGGDDDANDEDDDARAKEAAAAAAAVTAELTVRFEGEFERVFSNWRRLGESINWLELSDTLDLGLKAPKNGVKHGIMELWYVDMGKVMTHLCLVPDPDRKLYGFLPKMATTSQGSIGALPASSYAERVNSVGNQILTKGNSLLSPDEINKVVVLRMNREYMKYMRQKHPEASLQHFNMTVLKPGDNVETGSGEEEEVEEEELAAAGV
jgi:hypothetical protein